MTARETEVFALNVIALTIWIELESKEIDLDIREIGGRWQCKELIFLSFVTIYSFSYKAYE